MDTAAAGLDTTAARMDPTSMVDAALEHYARAYAAHYESLTLSGVQRLEDSPNLWAVDLCTDLCERAPLIGLSFASKVIDLYGEDSRPGEQIRLRVLGLVVMSLRPRELHAAKEMITSSPVLQALIDDLETGYFSDKALNVLNTLRSGTSN